jgi:hypothetical protein
MNSVVSVGTIQMSVQSELPIGIDMTNFLAAVEGATLSSPTATLEDSTTNEGVTGFTSSPVIEDNVVVQVVLGSLLTIGRTYDLFLGFTGATGFIPVGSVHIRVGP